MYSVPSPIITHFCLIVYAHLYCPVLAGRTSFLTVMSTLDLIIKLLKHNASSGNLHNPHDHMGYLNNWSITIKTAFIAQSNFEDETPGAGLRGESENGSQLSLFQKIRITVGPF